MQVAKHYLSSAIREEFDYGAPNATRTPRDNGHATGKL
jgi:hypothetical protein